MDDLALLDLLECPVCFEKLDASAKVLPCQHTFCKPCLQRILKSQKELRCPECRTLVLGSIEQLPSNLLLIRLLDGVRCGQNVSRFGSVQRSGVLSSPASIRRVPRGLQLHQHRLATNPRISMEGVPRARALYSYRGHNPGELRFNKGDTIALLRQLDDNWYLGELNGASGVFPASSVQVIKQLPLPRPLYSPELRGRDKADGKDILTFPKVPPGTAGLCGSPGPGAPLWGSPSARTLQLPCPAIPQGTQGAWHRSGEGQRPRPVPAQAPGPRLQRPSRHPSLAELSFQAPLPGRIVLQPPFPGRIRPALHISPPVLISSSNPSVPTQSCESAELPCGTPLQVSTSYYPVSGTLGPPAAIVTLPHLQHHGPAYLYVRELEYLGTGCHLLTEQGQGPLTRWDGTRQPSPFFSNRKSSLSDSKMPSLYASWTLSTSSLSSQGSGSLSELLHSKSVPGPSGGHGGSPGSCSPTASCCERGYGSLQRPGQAGTPVQITGSLRRPTAAGRAQHFQLYPHSIAPGSGTDETTRPNSSYEAAPALLVRGGESRSPSVCSSVILDAKDPSVKSEAAPKPPASAPPSILVKPETSRNSAEKQVKTVRFQNHSPPPPKRH
ncbi:SH3R2 ligase, partial [Nesospiza acunhae]|nr:SH3R2 ligase [Nesospiza acunhae]